MKTTLYYFTGTGNSLTIARRLASLIGETELIPIPALMQGEGIINAPEGRVGICCPVYDMGIPVLVRDFLERLVVADNGYVFAVLTLGGTGAAALKLVDTGIRNRNGRGINAGFLVKMPGNFPPIGVPPVGAKQASILEKAKNECVQIATAIRNGEEKGLGFTPLTSLIQFMLYGPFAKNVRSSGEKFSVSEACTSCGTCALVCPTGNITMVDGHPVYANRCELCCACLNYCPVQAINLNMLFGTEGRGRYHHPDVTPADMQMQKGLPE